jgi:hypothetical protein
MKPVTKKPPSGKNSFAGAQGMPGIARRFVQATEEDVRDRRIAKKRLREVASQGVVTGERLENALNGKRKKDDPPSTPKRIREWRLKHREELLEKERERAKANRAKRKAAKVA